MSAALVEEVPAADFDDAAGFGDWDEETFFAGTACFATAVFLTAGLETGCAWATGFFTVTGSFDELVHAFNGDSPQENHAARKLHGSPPCQGARRWRTRGLYPRTQAGNVRSSMPKVTQRPGKKFYGLRNRRAIV
ncbi:hypothetical protein A8M77_11805 [Variovorax sp. JS1663]|nr:hypothetical protein A8M77_11805 [Variovorax sp. JS1663]